MKKIIAVLFLAQLAYGYATPTFVQKATCWSASSSGANCGPLTVTAGDMLVACCAAGQLASTQISVSDNNGGKWINAAIESPIKNGALNTYQLIAFSPNHPGGATTVSCIDPSGSTQYEAAVDEYSNVAGDGSYDVSSSSSPASSLANPTSNAMNAHFFNELIFNCSTHHGGSVTGQSGTLRTNTGVEFFQATQDVVVSTPQIYTSNFTATAGFFVSRQVGFCPSDGCIGPGLMVSP